MLILQDSGSTAKSGFLNDGDAIDETEEDGSDEENELFDSVCAICDNGGELLWYLFIYLFLFLRVKTLNVLIISSST